MYVINRNVATQRPSPHSKCVRFFLWSKYRGEKKGLYVLLSRGQSGPGKNVSQPRTNLLSLSVSARKEPRPVLNLHYTASRAQNLVISGRSGQQQYNKQDVQYDTVGLFTCVLGESRGHHVTLTHTLTHTHKATVPSLRLRPFYFK